MALAKISNGTLFIAALIVLISFQNLRAAGMYAENYEEALTRAKETGKDIVVLQRGSDWNRLGERIYNDVWLKDEFVKALGDGVILVAVDYPEQEGAPALRGSSPASTEASPVSRLMSLVDEKTPLPVNQITSVEAKDGSVFKKRADTAWLAEGANPGQETLTLRLKTSGGQVLRLDFPTDPSLPGNGPGRASNGNFALSEVEIIKGDIPLKPVAAWGSAQQGAWSAWQAIDGISDTGDNLWNPQGDHHRPRTLLLALDKPVPSGTELTVRLICRSQWGQHVPGCLRASMIADKVLARDIVAVSAAKRLQEKNNRFTWWDRTYCPRIALMDREGRAVACENKPRLYPTPAALAQRVKELRAVREKRDALWTKAEAAQGPERAELYRQSLDAMGFANWAGNDNCYKAIHDKIREADPKDESGAVRWLTFGADPRHGLQWTEPSWSKALDKKDLTDEDFKEALARIDKELKDPRNRVLDHERIQRIMVAKYLVYRRWPKHEEQRFDIQREIAAFDPDTFWGIGARGELGLHHHSTTPMLTYGWAAIQIKSGTNIWDMSDTSYLFDHAGPYKVRVKYAGGKDTLKVCSIALLDGATVIAEARPNASVGPTNACVEVDLDFKGWRSDHKAILRVESEVADGHTDITGNFGVEPQLLKMVAGKKAKTITEKERLRTLDKVDALRTKWDDALTGKLGSQNKNLARAEVIRVCGTEKVADICLREGGEDFVVSFLKDTDWMESFLASGTADWPQSLENLYLLSLYAKDFDKPFNQRLATALALQWGNGSRYRLVHRYHHVLQALQEGLMHVSFERLNVREMRWAVPTYGTAKDFQFLLDDRQTPLRDYLGAHGGVWYVSYNVYGVSVQDGWNYIGPWAHVYGEGTGNRPFPAHKQVGGVCGTVSTYGSATAQAHGIPSTAIGQPGHCAYIVRVGQEWPVGNSVTWPSHTSAPGWDGTGYSTLHRLYEPVNQDRERFMKATRLGWLARLLADREKARIRIMPGIRYSLYKQGVGAALPDFSKLTPESTGTCASFDLASLQPIPANNFGIVWEGQIEVIGKGGVRVSLRSDDGSRILLDGQVAVTANCSQEEKEIALAPGRHDVRVEFCQGSGNLYLTVGFEGVPPAPSTGWFQFYDRALWVQPENYGIWISAIKDLEAAGKVTTEAWLALGRRAASDLSLCNEAGWAITMRCLDKVLPGMKPEERMELLTYCNKELRQENWIKPEGFPYDGILNWQADRIADPKLAVKFFGRQLEIHHSMKPDGNWIFGNILSWGANRFAGNPATAADYAQVMEAFFNAKGEALDKNLLATTIQSNIRKASETSDIVSYRLWTAMAAKMLPPVKPEDVHLNAAQAAAAPVHSPFRGDLLSKDGMLKTSSAGQHDKPLSYAHVLGGGTNAYFDTNNEDKPWAQVQLPGEAELSGIVLLNRYEYAPEMAWAVPLKVSVSLDGKSWTDVAFFDKSDSLFRVDLQGKGLKARFVRIERLLKKDTAQPPGRFHFRNFLVYGKKLY
jgi:hypothetical protein